MQVAKVMHRQFQDLRIKWTWKLFTKWLTKSEFLIGNKKNDTIFLDVKENAQEKPHVIEFISKVTDLYPRMVLKVKSNKSFFLGNFPKFS